MSARTRERVAFLASAACIGVGVYYGMDFPRALLRIASMLVLWALLWAVFARALGLWAFLLTQRLHD